MSDYFPLFYMNVITHPCPNHDAGLVNLKIFQSDRARTLWEMEVQHT